VRARKLAPAALTPLRSQAANHRRRNMAPICGGGTVVKNLKRVVSWLVVFAVGLAPMLVYWVAGLIRQAFRRKRGAPGTGSRPLENIGEGQRHHRREAAPPANSDPASG